MTSSAASTGIDPASLIAFAHELADLSGPVCRRYFRGDTGLEDKADASPVTLADRAAEQVMRDHINRHRPADGIIAEEFGNERTDADIVWVLDPIDGTRAFASGLPVYGTLIGALQGERMLAGLCDMPSLGERYAAPDPAGELTASDCTALSKARVRYTSHEIFSAGELDAVRRLTDDARFLHPGGDCYNYCLLAAGHCDLVVESALNPYDIMALVPVVEAAGGIITDWTGAPVTLASARQVLAAATPELHAQALPYLSSVADRP